LEEVDDVCVGIGAVLEVLPPLDEDQLEIIEELARGATAVIKVLGDSVGETLAALVFKRLLRLRREHYFCRERMMKAIMKKIRNRRIEIQIGDNTHSHGQLIWPVSLRATNRRVNHPGSPMEVWLF